MKPFSIVSETADRYSEIFWNNLWNSQVSLENSVAALTIRKEKFCTHSCIFRRNYRVLIHVNNILPSVQPLSPQLWLLSHVRTCHMIHLEFEQDFFFINSEIAARWTLLSERKAVAYKQNWMERMITSHSLSSFPPHSWEVCFHFHLWKSFNHYFLAITKQCIQERNRNVGKKQEQNGIKRSRRGYVEF